MQTTVNAIPEALGKLTQMLVPLEQRFHQYQIDIKAVDIMNNVVANLPKPDANVVMSRVSDVAMGTMTWLLYWISISVVAFYFLLDGYKITDSLINLFPIQQQPFMRHVANDADKSLQSFFRGQLVLGIAFGLFMLVVLHCPWSSIRLVAQCLSGSHGNHACYWTTDRICSGNFVSDVSWHGHSRQYSDTSDYSDCDFCGVAAV